MQNVSTYSVITLDLLLVKLFSVLIDPNFYCWPDYLDLEQFNLFFGRFIQSFSFLFLFPFLIATPFIYEIILDL